MDQNCYSTTAPGLEVKGVSRVIDCSLNDIRLTSIPEIREFLTRHAESVIGKPVKLEYDSSEPIGYTHSLFRFHIPIERDKYIGVRLVLRGEYAIRVIYTIPRDIDLAPRLETSIYQPSIVNNASRTMKQVSEPPRGQYYVEIPIVYAILGVPKVDVSKWTLEVTGEVEQELRLTLADLYELGVEELRTSFHCVTGWSLREVSFTGVPFRKILDLAKPLRTARWVYAESLDSYTTIIPYSEIADSNALIALEMNNKPLDILHGYPARLIIPHLYGWKSAKWLKRISFLREYRDGYWEALGYHPRGRVDLEERFKEP